MRSPRPGRGFLQKRFFKTIMKHLLLATLATLVLCVLSDAPFTKISAQTQTATGSEADRILAAFKAKEAAFRSVLNGYGLKRDAVIQSLGMGGQVTGEYHRVSY